MSATIGLGIAITLADMFSPKLKQAGKGLGSFNAKLAATSTAAVGIGKSLTAGLGKFYDAFGETAQKQGDLMSLGVDAKGMQDITKKGLKFANTWSNVVAKDFIGAAYDIKSGISSLTDDGVGEMTRYALLTGKATKSSSETMSKSFALGYGIFRDEFKDDFDFGKKFSASFAATVQLFRTDGEDLARGISNLGAVAKSFGVSLSEELSVLGMSKGAFDSAAEGATGYKAFLMGATKAQKGLGLSFVDKKGQLLSIADILDKIKKKFGKLDAKEIGILKKEFGSDEAVKIILALIDKTDQLRESQKKLNDAQNRGLDYTTKMAQAREYGQEAKLLGDQMSSLAYIFGERLSPAMGWVATKMGSLVTWTQDFVSENKELTGNIATGLVVFAGLATVLGTIGIAVAGITFGMKALGIASMAAFAPLLISVGLVALAAYAVIDNWELVSTFWSGMWKDFVKGVNEAIELVTTLGGLLPNGEDQDVLAMKNGYIGNPEDADTMSKQVDFNAIPSLPPSSNSVVNNTTVNEAPVNVYVKGNTIKELTDGIKKELDLIARDKESRRITL